MTANAVTIYTRQGCHLCEDAVELLRGEGIEPELIDIDADPELSARWTKCVPVVVIDGKERFRGKIDPRLLRRLIRAR